MLRGTEEPGDKVGAYLEWMAEGMVKMRWWHFEMEGQFWGSLAPPGSSCYFPEVGGYIFRAWKGSLHEKSLPFWSGPPLLVTAV